MSEVDEVIGGILRSIASLPGVFAAGSGSDLNTQDRHYYETIWAGRGGGGGEVRRFEFVVHLICCLFM